MQPKQPASKQPPESRAKAGAGATSGVDFRGFDAYLDHHRQVARDSLRRLLQRPLGSLVTWAGIAIALALPAGLFALLSNVEQLGQHWSGTPRITLYLDLRVGETEAYRLQQSLQQRKDVAEVAYISPQAALAEFRQQSGLGEAIDYLDENPLPPVLVVTPAADLASAAAVEALLKELQNLAQVGRAQLDMDWVKRLYSLMTLVERLAWALGIMLAAAVLLVVGNTIRLNIENRREEIVVIKLVGGTDAFVRRPFLYTGLWYGLGGGILAWILVFFWILWLSGPVEELARLYFMEFDLEGLGLEATLTLLFGGMALGWVGAWLAVRRHLSAIEPE